LRARCSVIAAANPLNGRYNSSLSFSENIDLSEPILSRFDILNVIKDESNSDLDYHLSTFVINSHIKNHPYHEKYVIPENYLTESFPKNKELSPDFLSRYIKYAREKIRPELTEKNREMIRQFYVQLRE